MFYFVLYMTLHIVWIYWILLSVQPWHIIPYVISHWPTGHNKKKKYCSLVFHSSFWFVMVLFWYFFCSFLSREKLIIVGCLMVVVKWMTKERDIHVKWWNLDSIILYIIFYISTLRMFTIICLCRSVSKLIIQGFTFHPHMFCRSYIVFICKVFFYWCGYKTNFPLIKE